MRRTTLNLSGTLAILALSIGARAQSVRTGATAVAESANGAFIVGGNDDDRSSNALTGFRTEFGGQDRDGTYRTMGFSADAYAESSYGRLRARVSGGVDDTFYSEENEPFDAFGGGSPSSLDVFGIAAFTDTLQFGGVAGADYSARYVFRVDGYTDAADAEALTTLSFSIGDQYETFAVPAGVQGYFSSDFATKSYPVDGMLNQTVSVFFFTRVLFGLEDFEDGSSHSASTDFTSTAALTNVLLYDAAGSLVSNYTVTGESKTVYPTQAVPEPASFAALGFGALAMLRRRSGRPSPGSRARRRAASSATR